MSPLVCVHGFMGGSDQWAPQRAGLSDTLDIIAIDLPGFGGNAHLPPIDTIGGFAEWVLSDLRRRNVGKYHLLGHSMGGMIVQEMARRDQNNIESLVLYGTGSTGVLPGRFETISESKARIKTDGPKATARRISATWFLDREADKAYEGCAHIAELASVAAMIAGLDAMEAWSGSSELAAINIQSLVLWGDQDRSYSWEQTEQLWRGLPSANLAVVPGCAHAVHLEKPDLFNSLILDFFSTHTF